MNVLKTFNNNEYTTNGLKVFDGENWVPAGLNVTQNVGEELNFKVVGGTTQPSSASENTIWVNTSTAITEWVFSATEPTNPVAGMVWFNIGTSCSAPINAIKKNGLMVYPVGCQQYINGAWVTKEAKTYQGGAWVDWTIVRWIYKMGTGQILPLSTYTQSVGDTSWVNITDNEITVGGSVSSAVLTTNALNLDNVITVYVEATFTSLGSADWQGAIVAKTPAQVTEGNSVSARNPSMSAARKVFEANGTKTIYSLDVSSLTGAHHVGASGDMVGTIHNIYYDEVAK